MNQKQDTMDTSTTNSSCALPPDPSPLPANSDIEANNKTTQQEKSPYDLPVDPEDDDRATALRIFSTMRPHMRSFYAAMLTFFIGSMIWVVVSPLQTTIAETTGISQDELFTASIASMVGNFVARIAAGSLCDLFGARRVAASLILWGAIACALTALVQHGSGLALSRLFTGMAGGTLVISQFWMAQFFSQDIIGLATGLVLGIGYAGGGFALLILGTGVLPLFEKVAAEDVAWRLSLIIPTVIALFGAIWVWVCTDDTPKGKITMTEQKQIQKIDEETAGNSFQESHSPSWNRRFQKLKAAALNLNTWILFLQYGVSSGGNAAMLNAAPLYFEEVLGMSLSGASAVSSAVGWLSLLCFVGGWTSDRLMASSMNMGGRKLAQFTFLVVGGGLILAFSYPNQVGWSIGIFIAFSLFLTLTTGSTFALVVYVDKDATGSVAGIVASGGSVGAVAFLFMLREMEFHDAFLAMGVMVIAVACLTLLLRFPNQTQ